ncbi:hypothetical protein P280DRAFT_480903 [Massarina eburnea CBS 473.64]|uniref:Uncharacterized protein n=1 Tax=Massarina eburnea CBS 473.64 TaxID=1395130 RepID=A0A6A6RWC8_9PLEO|nr:hypothetical protein P280DRAFT_480903 [Massarina eburnea CBS 473.64]
MSEPYYPIPEVQNPGPAEIDRGNDIIEATAIVAFIISMAVISCYVLALSDRNKRTNRTARESDVEPRNVLPIEWGHGAFGGNLAVDLESRGVPLRPMPVALGPYELPEYSTQNGHERNESADTLPRYESPPEYRQSEVEEVNSKSRQEGTKEGD